MMTVPLETGYCPERWKQAIDVMLGNIPGVSRSDKLRMIKLLEADLNPVLRVAFVWNITKLAKHHDCIISEHQYGRAHKTCMAPVLNKLLTVQLLIQKQKAGIVFDNDAKGCYDIIISIIALVAIRIIGYSKNSVNLLGRLWAELEHHNICTGYGVLDKTYKSAIDKLLYGIGQGSCASPIIWALLKQLLLMALCEKFDFTQLVDIEGTTHTRPGYSLVDDTTTDVTNDDVSILPVDSCEQGLAEEEEKLVAKMETTIQFFLECLQATGGYLAPSKCAWYLTSHHWKDGIPRLLQSNPTHHRI
jgi:hypothetical protein